jgi:hypothetical protein
MDGSTIAWIAGATTAAVGVAAFWFVDSRPERPSLSEEAPGPSLRLRSEEERHVETRHVSVFP